MLLSTLPVAITHGRYLFQSRLRISVGCAGTSREGFATWSKGGADIWFAGRGRPLSAGGGAYDGVVRRSNIFRVPSVEHDARIEGVWGEKRAW